MQKYHWNQEEARSMVHQFSLHYQLEGGLMAYTLQDLARDFTREHLHELPVQERMKGVSPEERMKGVSPEERLKGISFEERFKGLDLKEIEALVKKMKEQKS